MTKILFITSKSIYTCAAQRTLLEMSKKQIEKGNEVAILLIQDRLLHFLGRLQEFVQTSSLPQYSERGL